MPSAMELFGRLHGRGSGTLSVPPTPEALAAGPPTSAMKVFEARFGPPPAPSLLDLSILPGVSLRRLGNVAVENLPMLGGMAGGVIGALPAIAAGPLGLLTAPTGAGLGFAAGSRLRGAIRGEDLPSVPEMAGELLTGAAGEMGGQLVAKGISKGVEAVSEKVIPFVKGARTAKAREFMKGAAEFEIPTTAAERSGSRTLSQLEAFPTRVPAGAGTMETMTTAQREAQQRAAGRFAFPPGEAPDPSVVGGVVQETARRPAQQAITATEDMLRREFPGPPPSPSGVGQRIQETVSSQRTAAEQATAEARRQATERLGFQGQRSTPLQVGTTTQEAATIAERAARDEAAPLYRRVEQLVGPDPVIPSANLAEVSSSVVQREAAVRGVHKAPLARTAAGLEDVTTPPPPLQQTLPPTPQLRLPDRFGGDIIRPESPGGVIEQLGLAEPRQLTFQAARDIQSRLGELMRTTRDRFERAQFAALQAAISRDIEAFGEATGGEVSVALRTANDFFRERVARVFINDEAGRRTFVATLGRTKPELVVDTIRTVSDVRNLRAALGAGSPEMVQVEQAFMQRLIDRATDPMTGQINPAVFVKAVTKKGPEFFGELLGQQRFAQLQQTLTQFRAGQVPESAFLSSVGKLSPEKVVGQVRTINDVRDLMRTLGPTSPEIEQVRQSVMRPIIDAATDQATGQVSPALFARELQKHGPEFITELLGRRRARDLFVAAEQMARTGTPTAPFLKAVAGAKPESVVGMVKTVSDAGELMRALGPGSREADLVRRSYVQQFIDAATKGNTEPFQPAVLLNKFAQSTPEFRRVFFGPAAAAELDRFLGVLSRQMQFSGARLGQSTSPGILSAGQVLGAVSVISGGMTGIASGNVPVGAMTGGLVLLTPHALAKFLTNPRGIRLLTEGIRTGPGTPQAARISAQVAAQVTEE